MATAPLTYHRRARWTLEELPASEQKEIRAAVNSLVNLPPDRWPSDRVHLIDPVKARYMLLATPDWRVFFTRSTLGEIEITVIMHEETIRAFHSAESGSDREE